MVKEVQYQGYATEPSDYECSDGQMATSINLISEDGQLKPLFQPATLAEIPSGMRVLAIHDTSSFVGKHYIIQDTSGNYPLSWWDGGQQLTFTEIAASMPIINHIEPIGNTLVALTDNGLYYFLWNGTGYTSLGQQIPEVDLSFSLAYLNYTSDGLSLSNNWNDYNGVNHSNDFSDEDKITYNNMLHGAINKLIAEKVTGKGRFCMPFFVRYAYRMYDGSLVMHSAPVLMLPLNLYAYKDNDNTIKITVFASRLQYQALPTTSALNKWKDIVTSVDIFVSAPIWTYDAAKDIDNVFGGHYTLPGVGRYDDNYSRPYTVHAGGDSTGNTSVPAIPQHDRASVIEKMSECAQFYLLHSLAIDNLSTTRTSIIVPDDYLQSLVNRELMSDDYFGHEVLNAKCAFTYNGRINLANITRQLYEGYNPFSDFIYSETYDSTNNTIGANSTVKVRVEIVRDGKTIVVSRTATQYNGLKQWPLDKNGVCWFFYPDPNAKRAWLYIDNDCYSLPLKPHNTLNGAYFCRLNGPEAETGTVPDVTTDRTILLSNKLYTSEINNPFFFPLLGINTIGTGDIIGLCAAVKALSQGQFGQFPLYAFTTDGIWALATTSTGGYESIQPVTRDVCSNADSITQIDNAVLFATLRGIMLIQGSQTQCITDGIFSEAPFNVLDLPHIDQLHSKLGHGADTCLPVKPFLGFLEGCKMIYDYIHQHIIVYNPSLDDGSPLYTYAYVFSLKSKMWGMMFSCLSSGINAYPDAMAMTHDNRLVSFSGTDETVSKGMYITRPLKLDAPDVHKTVTALIQRGHFQRGDVGTVLYGSRDLYDWELVWSSKDQYLRGFRGTAYKYFRIAGLAELSDGKSIFGASVNCEPRHTNNLR
jgi:hypothetical protein